MTKRKGMIRFGKIKIQNVLPHIGSPDRVPFDIGNERFRIKMSGVRLELIKSTQHCAACLIEAKFFWLERSGCWPPHFNLYGYNHDGAEVMMTMDHIKPKSLGGETALDNVQLLCENCNRLKDNKPITLKGIMQLRFSGGGDALFVRVINSARKKFPDQEPRIRQAFRDRKKKPECLTFSNPNDSNSSGSHLPSPDTPLCGGITSTQT